MRTLLLYISMLLISTLSYAQSATIEADKKLLEKYELENNYNQAAYYCMKIGLAYSEKQTQENEAIAYFKKAIPFYEKLNNNYGLSQVYQNIAGIYSQLKQYDEAVLYFEKTIEKAKTLSNKSILLYTLINKAVTLELMQKYEAGIVVLKEALDYAKQQKSKKLMRTCYEMMAKNYKLLGDDENSIKYYDLFLVYQKQIDAEKIKKKEQAARAEVSNIASQKQKVEQEKQQLGAKLKSTKLALVTAEKELLEKEKAEMLRKEQERIAKEKRLAAKEALNQKRSTQYYGILIFIIILFGITYLLGKFQLPERVLRTIVLVSILLFFEFFLVFTDPYIDNFTDNTPLYKLGINFTFALVILPVHEFLIRLFIKTTRR